MRYAVNALHEDASTTEESPKRKITRIKASDLHQPRTIQRNDAYQNQALWHGH